MNKRIHHIVAVALGASLAAVACPGVARAQMGGHTRPDTAASARNIHPDASRFYYPDLGSYNGPKTGHNIQAYAYVSQNHGVTNYWWRLDQLNGFSGAVGGSYSVNIQPSSGAAVTENGQTKSSVVVLWSQVPGSYETYTWTAESPASVHAWALWLPALHCNAFGGFVYRNLDVEANVGSQDDTDVCSTKREKLGKILGKILATAQRYAAGLGAQNLNPDASAFALPANVVGKATGRGFSRYVSPKPHFVSFDWEVWPAGFKGQPEDGSYDVFIFPSAADAARWDNAIRQYRDQPYRVRFPLLPGESFYNGGGMTEVADMTWRNLVLSASIYDRLQPGPRYEAWLQTAMRLLYAHARQYASQH